MGKFIEFAEVLEKKIRKDLREETFSPGKTAEMPMENDDLPLGFAWILAQGSPTTGLGAEQETRRAHQAYGVKVRPLPPHKLTQTQQFAKDLFAQFGANLSPAFRSTELRKAWRHVAKSTHPDHGGNAESFRKAQSAYQALRSLFN